VQTCTLCHSESFATAYLDTADKGTMQGIKVEQEAKGIINNLYKDGLLVGQQTNRPIPPKPEKDAVGGFFQLFWAKGNNPSRVERIYADMWEHDLIKHYKGIFHANPGGYTYTEGWSTLMRDYTDIMDEDTRLREAVRNKSSTVSKAGQQAVTTSNDKMDYGIILASVILILGGLFIGYLVLKPKQEDQ
jgi:hydroxylamine dehydrogenase